MPKLWVKWFQDAPSIGFTFVTSSSYRFHHRQRKREYFCMTQNYFKSSQSSLGWNRVFVKPVLYLRFNSMTRRDPVWSSPWKTWVALLSWSRWRWARRLQLSPGFRRPTAQSYAASIWEMRATNSPEVHLEYFPDALRHLRYASSRAVSNPTCFFLDRSADRPQSFGETRFRCRCWTLDWIQNSTQMMLKSFQHARPQRWSWNNHIFMSKF